jgi:hypothetical protein
MDPAAHFPFVGTGQTGTYFVSERGPGYEELKYRFVVLTTALVYPVLLATRARTLALQSQRPKDGRPQLSSTVESML